MDITGSTEDRELTGREHVRLAQIREEARFTTPPTDIHFLLSILDRHKANLLAATDRAVELERELSAALGVLESEPQLAVLDARTDLAHESMAVKEMAEQVEQLEEKVERLEGQVAEHREHISSLIQQLADCEKKRDEDLEQRQALVREQEQRAADVRELVAVILDDNVTDYGDICPGKMHEALAKVEGWLPKQKGGDDASTCS